MSDLLARLTGAFGTEMPTGLGRLAAPNTTEYNDAAAITGRPWNQLTLADLTQYSDAFYGLDPARFKYYLPAVVACSVRDLRPDITVVQAITVMLDRSPQPELWDDYFIERWMGLTPSQYDALQQWILWMSELNEELGGPNQSELGRALDTLILLAHETVRRHVT